MSKIKDGSYPVEKGTLFCVADEYKVDPLLKWEQSELECRKKSCVIYSNRDGYDAHFKLTVIYGYDKEKNKVYPIKYLYTKFDCKRTGNYAFLTTTLIFIVVYCLV